MILGSVEADLSSVGCWAHGFKRRSLTLQEVKPRSNPAAESLTVYQSENPPFHPTRAQSLEAPWHLTSALQLHHEGLCWHFVGAEGDRVRDSGAAWFWHHLSNQDWRGIIQILLRVTGVCLKPSVCADTKSHLLLKKVHFEPECQRMHQENTVTVLKTWDGAFTEPKHCDVDLTQ